MNSASKPSERQIFRLLELIDMCQVAIERNQNAPEPSELVIDEYRDLLDQYKAELAVLMLSYGLRYVPERDRLAA